MLPPSSTRKDGEELESLQERRCSMSSQSLRASVEQLLLKSGDQVRRVAEESDRFGTELVPGSSRPRRSSGRTLKKRLRFHLSFRPRTRSLHRYKFVRIFDFPPPSPSSPTSLSSLPSPSPSSRCSLPPPRRPALQLVPIPRPAGERPRPPLMLTPTSSEAKERGKGGVRAERGASPDPTKSVPTQDDLLEA